MADILGNPVWQGVGVIVAILLGFIGFYYAGGNKVWLIIAATIILLIIGFVLGRRSLVNNNSSTFAIEQIPHEVFAYAGNDIKDGGKGTFSLVYDSDRIPNYKLEYFLLGDKYGYAGLAFKFPKAQDFSDFHAIECTIIFTEPNDQIELYAKDISNHSDSILVAPKKDSKVMVLHYEFTNFPNVVFSAIQEFGVIASTDYVTGSHDVRIKSLRFVK
jgi:hypothetical protein